MSSTRLDIQGNGPPDLSFLTHAENGSWREISGWLLPVAAIGAKIEAKWLKKEG